MSQTKEEKVAAQLAKAMADDLRARLLDAANVAAGKFTSFFDPAWMRVR